MKYFILLLTISSITSTTFAQIGAKTQQGKIHGIWQNDEFGYQMTLMLNANGTGEFDGEAITFTTQGTTLSITQGGMKNSYSYVLQGNTLTLSGGDLDKAITFKKGGTGESTPPATSNTPSNAKQSSSGLIGAWSGNGETVEFKSNGQVGYLGQDYPYQVLGNYITVQTQQGNLYMTYAIVGEQLQLTVNNQTVTYTKGKGNGSTTAGNKPQGSAAGNHIDQSMVGKWCYVNVTSTNSGGVSADECFLLNADGTYQYHSERSMSVNTNAYAGGTSSQNDDRGTWWISGNRLYYNSTTRGQGSYQFEKRNHPKNGDPMIVIEGTSYVTYYNKSPW